MELLHCFGKHDFLAHVNIQCATGVQTHHHRHTHKPGPLHYLCEHLSFGRIRRQREHKTHVHLAVPRSGQHLLNQTVLLRATVGGHLSAD